MTWPTWALPNGHTTRQVIWRVVAVQLLCMTLLWSFAPPQPIPYPGEVGTAWVGLLRGGLLWELGSSFMTNIEAIGIASVISLLLAYATVLPAMRSVAGAVAAARNFGVTGFVVLFTVAFGAGHGLRIALLSFCMIPFFVSSMSAVVASIPREEWDGARVLRMSRWRAVWEIVVLGKADQAFEVLRQNAAMGWMCLTMVEGLSRSEGGIGIMMLDQNKHFNLPAVFAIQGTIFLVGLFQDAMLAQIRRWACPYADLALERD